MKGGESQPPTTCFLCGSVEKALYRESTELTARLRITGLEGAADCSGAAEGLEGEELRESTQDLTSNLH